MAWFELTLETSPEHEELVDEVYSALYLDSDDMSELSLSRNGQWSPHVSIAYDNPEDSPLDDIYAEKLFAKMPCLLGCKKRDVTAISLWKTEGQVRDWVCIEKVPLKKQQDLEEEEDIPEPQ